MLSLNCFPELKFGDFSYETCRSLVALEDVSFQGLEYFMLDIIEALLVIIITIAIDGWILLLNVGNFALS